MRLLFASVCLAVGLCTSAVAQDTKQPTLVFSAWTKGCVQADARERTCAVRKTGRLEAGTPVVAASLIESTGSSKKILRVTLPVGMSLKPGTRVIIDQGQPATAAYVNCVADGCMADYDVNADMINRLKKGQGLVVQGINGSGQAISLVVPLSDFAKAYDGPPSDSAAFEEGQKKLSAELRPTMPLPESTVFSPWTRFCIKGQDGKQVCFTGKDARAESGVAVAAAVLIEPEGEQKKVLRITLPLGISLKEGTRSIIDQGQPAVAPYVICFANGCMADYEASAEMVGRLKTGSALTVQGVSGGQPISLRIPLADFAKAHDGPPTDPKVFEAQQKKLQEELQRRHEEAQRKSSPGQPAAPPQTASAPVNPVVAAPSPSSAALGRRVALVIGNSAYRSASVLPNPQRDAEAMVAALRRVGFQTVTLETNLSKDRLVAALRAFAREAETADWAMVYFAGHGIEMNGVNYLIPVDAKLEVDRDVEFEAVPLGQVMSAVDGAQKLRLVLLDACRDNPFARQMRRTAAVRSIGRGLARVEPDPGTLVVYAAKHGEVALDGEGANSPFVSAFLKALTRPGVELRKFFDLVRDDVWTSTNRRQQPFSYGSLPGSEDFFFVNK